GPRAAGAERGAVLLRVGPARRRVPILRTPARTGWQPGRPPDRDATPHAPHAQPDGCATGVRGAGAPGGDGGGWPRAPSSPSASAITATAGEPACRGEAWTERSIEIGMVVWNGGSAITILR